MAQLRAGAVRKAGAGRPGRSRYWSAEEHRHFIEALLRFGPKDTKAIAQYVGTRSMAQCRTHAQKWFSRLAREACRQTDRTAVEPSYGISLLSVVSEDMTRALQR